MAPDPIMTPKEITLLRTLALSDRIFISEPQRLRLELFGYIRDLATGVVLTPLGQARAMKKVAEAAPGPAAKPLAPVSKRDSIGRRINTGSRWLD